jgi:chemotaxis protein methyltransferase CheR
MVRQGECVEFLQWCLPRLRMRWAGFRKVRSQVCKRIARRMKELDFDDIGEYRRYLQLDDDEWQRLDAMCRITISRFFRDRAVFEALETEVFPALASAAIDREERTIKIWSCGCASGEEVYAIAVLWKVRVAERTPWIDLEIIATDSDERMLERARRGTYGAGSVKELPVDLRRSAFEKAGEPYRVRNSLQRQVSWLCQDIRSESPEGPFDLILCRNLVLTYFDEELQLEVMNRVVSALRVGGALVIGSHESLPPHDIGCEPWSPSLPIFRRVH